MNVLRVLAKRRVAEEPEMSALRYSRFFSVLPRKRKIIFHYPLGGYLYEETMGRSFFGRSGRVR